MKKQGSGILFAIAAVLGIWWLSKKQAQATPNIPALPSNIPSGTKAHTTVIDNVVVNVPADPNYVAMRNPTTGQTAWIFPQTVTAYKAGGWIII